MDLDEFIELISSFKNRLYRIALWIVSNVEDAEDIVQEVTLKLWRMKDDLKKYRSVEALSVEMTKNMSINKLKSRRIVVGDEQLSNTSSGVPLEKRFEDQEKLSIVKQIIGSLPEQQKLVLQLRGVEEKDTKEIAQILNETENNIRVILSRARKNVRTAYQKIYSHENG